MQYISILLAILAAVVSIIAAPVVSTAWDPNYQVNWYSDLECKNYIGHSILIATLQVSGDDEVVEMHSGGPKGTKGHVCRDA